MIASSIVPEVILQSSLSAAGILMVFLLVARSVEKEIITSQTKASAKMMVKNLDSSDGDLTHNTTVAALIKAWQQSYSPDEAADTTAAAKNRSLLIRVGIIIGSSVSFCVLSAFLISVFTKISFLPLIGKAIAMTAVLVATEATFILAIASRFQIADSSVMQAQVQSLLQSLISTSTSTSTANEDSEPDDSDDSDDSDQE